MLTPDTLLHVYTVRDYEGNLPTVQSDDKEKME